MTRHTVAIFVLIWSGATLAFAAAFISNIWLAALGVVVIVASSALAAKL